MELALIAAMGGVGLEDVSVSGFQLFQDTAPVYHSRAAVVGECAEKNRVFTVLVRTDNEGGKPIPDDEFELVRPASQGIKELAPGNVFFARHYRLTVDGLVTTDWNDSDSVTEKRFCSECDYMEDEHPKHANVCPKCGSATFGTASNVHRFVRLESVRSWMHRRDAMADDRKDDRDKYI